MRCYSRKRPWFKKWVGSLIIMSIWNSPELHTSYSQLPHSKEHWGPQGSSSNAKIPVLPGEISSCNSKAFTAPNACLHVGKGKVQLSSSTANLLTHIHIFCCEISTFCYEALHLKVPFIQSLGRLCFLKPRPPTWRKIESGLSVDWGYQTLVLQKALKSSGNQFSGHSNSINHDRSQLCFCFTVNNLWDSLRIRKNHKGNEAPNLTNITISEDLWAKTCFQGQLQIATCLL